MRLFKSFSWVLLYGTFAFVCAIANAQTGGRIPGRIVVAKAIGTVTGTNLADKSQRALADNDVITQHYSVTTAANSRAVLVFSNGATINLGADATLSIEEFLQDPFDEKVVAGDLKEEPATSITRLNLARGELVGNVKHLKREKGSSFIVATPVGAAGIRGTTFRIVFRPDASGRVTFTLSTSEGAILFEAPAGTAGAAAGGVSVETGKEVTVDVDVAIDATTGALTVTGPTTISAPQDIPAATQATIATAAQQIIEASKSIILSTTPPSTTQTETGAPAKPTEETKAENPPPTEKPAPPFTPNENAAPVINTPQPDVTPGAGAN